MKLLAYTDWSKKMAIWGTIMAVRGSTALHLDRVLCRLSSVTTAAVSRPSNLVNLGKLTPVVNHKVAMRNMNSVFEPDQEIVGGSTNIKRWYTVKTECLYAPAVVEPIQRARYLTSLVKEAKTSAYLRIEAFEQNSDGTLTRAIWEPASPSFKTKLPSASRAKLLMAGTELMVDLCGLAKSTGIIQPLTLQGLCWSADGKKLMVKSRNQPYLVPKSMND